MQAQNRKNKQIILSPQEAKFFSSKRVKQISFYNSVQKGQKIPLETISFGNTQN
jgi:hypothetical protein